MIQKILRAFFSRKLSGTDCFIQELNTNIERVYVMEQQQNTGLRLDLSPDVVPGFDDYRRVVLEYNMAFDDHKAFFLKYKSDIDQQTRAQALVLDGLHEVLLQKFSVLKSVLLAEKDKAHSKQYV